MSPLAKGNALNTMGQYCAVEAVGRGWERLSKDIFPGSAAHEIKAEAAKRARRAYPNKQNPGVPIVASTLDRWPPSLLEHPDIRWLHPGLVKRLYSACLPTSSGYLPNPKATEKWAT